MSFAVRAINELVVLGDFTPEIRYTIAKNSVQKVHNVRNNFYFIFIISSIFGTWNLKKRLNSFKFTIFCVKNIKKFYKWVRFPGF